MSPNSNVHVLNSGTIQPSTGFLKCLDSPDPRGTIEAKEIEKHTINLLLNFEVERQVNILKASQKILVLVHKGPTSLHKR